MLRSVLANADAPAGAEEGAGQQPGEHAATEPSRERVNGHGADRAGAEQALWPSGADVTMPLPVLREQLRYLPLGADPAYAIDMTLPLPVFRDAIEFGRQPTETGPAPMDKDSADHARRDLRAVRHGTGWIADHGTAASGVPHKRGRHARPEAAGETNARPTGPNGRGNDG
jgi:hypothetical protein